MTDQAEYDRTLAVSLKTARSTYDAIWRELADYVQPERARFVPTDAGQAKAGSRTKILDETATYALRTSQAGMQSQLTSPARPWFALTLADKDKAKYRPARMWLEDCSQRMLAVLLGSNFYDQGSTVYGDELLFGNACLSMERDPKRTARFAAHPIGSYCWGGDHTGAVDTVTREFTMTADQVVAKFGEERVSDTVRALRGRPGGGQTQVTVVHVVRPNPDFNPRRIEAQFKRWRSCYYEEGRENQGYLREGGFDLLPYVNPRWSVTGTDVYGRGPGRDCLPSIKELQALTRRKSQIIEKGANPSLLAPTSLRNVAVNLLPGGITYGDETETGKIRPIHDVNTFKLEPVLGDLADLRKRVNHGLYQDLFLMFSQSDRREITAEEIRQRAEEKVASISPVLERQNSEFYGPLIDWLFATMDEAGMFAPPPDEIAGEAMKVEYQSALHQAAKAASISGNERLLGYAMQAAQANPEVLDKIDFDEAVDAQADALGVTPKIVRDAKTVAIIRQQRRQAQEQARQAAMAESIANTAKTLSETNVSGDNALTGLSRGQATAQVA